MNPTLEVIDVPGAMGYAKNNSSIHGHKYLVKSLSIPDSKGGTNKIVDKVGRISAHATVTSHHFILR